MSSYGPKAQRPKTIEGRGTVVSIERENLIWFEGFLRSYRDRTAVRRMVRKRPKIGAIKVNENGKEIALIVISSIGGNRDVLRVDHYSIPNIEADFSLKLNFTCNPIKIESMTPGCSKNNIDQVGHFVIGVYVYEYLMHLEKNAKTDTIAPIEIFDKPLV